MRFLIVILCLAISMGPFQAAAQSTAWQTNVDILVEKVKADKKLLVATNMDLTDEEAREFWPIYDTYQEKLVTINDRMAAVIIDYAVAYRRGSIADNLAKRLLKETVDIQVFEARAAQDISDQLLVVLPAAKAARYMQLELKIRSALRAVMAAEVPLVE